MIAAGRRPAREATGNQVTACYLMTSGCPARRRTWDPSQPRDPETGRWVSAFGEKPAEELAFHEGYFADAPDWLKNLIGETAPLGNIVYSAEGQGSFFRNAENEISLRQGMGFYEEAATWRHEYGHALDAAHGEPSSRLGDAMHADRELLASIVPMSADEYRRRALSKATLLLGLSGSHRESAARSMMSGDLLNFDDLKSMANLDMSNTDHVKLVSVLHAYSSTGYINGYVHFLNERLPLTEEHHHTFRMSADYIHAATGGAVGFGHAPEYYAQNWGTIGSGVNRAHALESFANHIAIAGSAPEVSAIHSKLVSAIVPNTWDTTEGILAGLVH